MICYHSKTPHSVNPLGVGMRVSKVPRTGLIKEAELFPYYINAKSFIKDFVRWSPSNEKYTHWLPLYFGEGDKEERFIKFAESALSMIITGNAKSFRPEFVLEVYPKIIVTLVYRIMDMKTHPSLNIIRFLTLIHSNFLFMFGKYPALHKIVEDSIKQFITDGSSRTKAKTTNLGAFLSTFFVARTLFKEVT
jgi:hypothetical protein